MPGTLFVWPLTVNISVKHWVAVPEAAAPAVPSGSAIVKATKSNLKINLKTRDGNVKNEDNKHSDYPVPELTNVGTSYDGQ